MSLYFWYKKVQARKQGTHYKHRIEHFSDIHMPRSTAAGFIISVFAAIFGFAMIWHMWIPAVLSIIGIMATIVGKSFFLNTDYYLPAAEVEAIEHDHYTEYHA